MCTYTWAEAPAAVCTVLAYCCIYYHYVIQGLELISNLFVLHRIIREADQAGGVAVCKCSLELWFWEALNLRTMLVTAELAASDAAFGNAPLVRSIRLRW